MSAAPIPRPGPQIATRTAAPSYGELIEQVENITAVHDFVAIEPSMLGKAVQREIIFAIARQTVLWRKPSDALSIRQLVEGVFRVNAGTGRNERVVRRELSAMRKAQAPFLDVTLHSGAESVYALNLDYIRQRVADWRCEQQRGRVLSPQSLAQKVQDDPCTKSTSPQSSSSLIQNLAELAIASAPADEQTRTRTEPEPPSVPEIREINHDLNDDVKLARQLFAQWCPTQPVTIPLGDGLFRQGTLEIPNTSTIRRCLDGMRRHAPDATPYQFFGYVQYRQDNAPPEGRANTPGLIVDWCRKDDSEVRKFMGGLQYRAAIAESENPAPKGHETLASQPAQSDELDALMRDPGDSTPDPAQDSGLDAGDGDAPDTDTPAPLQPEETPAWLEAHSDAVASSHWCLCGIRIDRFADGTETSCRCSAPAKRALNSGSSQALESPPAADGGSTKREREPAQ